MNTPTPQDIETAIHDHFSNLGKIGGKKAAAKLTPEEHSARGKNMASKRWGKKALEGRNKGARTEIAKSA